MLPFNVGEFAVTWRSIWCFSRHRGICEPLYGSDTAWSQILARNSRTDRVCTVVKLCLFVLIQCRGQCPRALAVGCFRSGYMRVRLPYSAIPAIPPLWIVRCHSDQSQPFTFPMTSSFGCCFFRDRSVSSEPEWVGSSIRTNSRRLCDLPLIPPSDSGLWMAICSVVCSFVRKGSGGETLCRRCHVLRVRFYIFLRLQHCTFCFLPPPPWRTAPLSRWWRPTKRKLGFGRLLTLDTLLAMPSRCVCLAVPCGTASVVKARYDKSHRKPMPSPPPLNMHFLFSH